MKLPQLIYPDQFDDMDSSQQAIIQYQNVNNKEFVFPKVLVKFYQLDKAGSVETLQAQPVLGLTQKQVDWVLSQCFGIPWSHISSIEYLWETGKNLWHHPLLRGHFDTAVRDGLANVSVEAIFRAFWLLSDYLYDIDTKYYKDAKEQSRWAHLATYLFWATSSQVGRGLPFRFAKLDQLQDNHPMEVENIRNQEKKFVGFKNKI